MNYSPMYEYREELILCVLRWCRILTENRHVNLLRECELSQLLIALHPDVVKAEAQQRHRQDRRQLTDLCSLEVEKTKQYNTC